MAAFTFDCECDVVRRVGWGDTDDLADHLDAVTEILRQSEDVRRVEIDANLDTGRVHLVVDFESWEFNRNEHARAVLSVAIRQASGRHQGLMPRVEAKGFGLDKESWSALRGPTWTVRKAVLEADEVG